MLWKAWYSKHNTIQYNTKIQYTLSAEDIFQDVSKRNLAKGSLSSELRIYKNFS